MERVGTLINNLKEQFEQQVNADKLAITAQLLLVELQKSHIPSSQSGKVSIILPKVTGNLFNMDMAPMDQLTSAITEKQEEPIKDWKMEDILEVPTLSHQSQIPDLEPRKHPKPKEIFEFNTVLANPMTSLNEKLKEERVELATALQDSPIRDLKKAIGLNDRFLFVQDLFRGDENMYERSIKTINAFTIYPEAEYWIQRELKVKLSWPDSNETVKHFDQLIKRRFS